MRFLFDSNYLMMVLLPTLLLSGLAQLFVRSAYSKWSKTPNGSGLKGPQVAQKLMRDHGFNIGLEAVPNELGDHYDPQTQIVRLSPSVSQNASVASMAIVAHELGHVQQHQEHSPLIGARNFLLPAVQFSPMLSYGMIMAGLLFRVTGLAWAGVAFFGVAVVFMILTLPIEIDASRRGLKILEESGLMITEDDRSGARQMLTAAAMTYVAAAVTALLQLLYYISLLSRRR